VYKYSVNRWRHYEHMKRLPEGLIIMGDAACSFNPVYGQGMSVAAIETQSLDDSASKRGKHASGEAA
jgi:2-polyprenyl-6-methoxyphenol hydroxylase-like FAD-dependent oxidoreductase